ncbi:MarR family winged helix-turn-helix transcriptional regulator [Mobilicoccus pelagius]|uniref:Putative MarR family transcriptional regulator n=1 Tax=Mobilicoccus pelagius NBRC 104925 TaxID=1089455 RepID=H5UMN7_9MICO|nr:MarR family transcriptional regulator [Mobilicoccus pelagius]GAB46995.1 putative MarR family transcriptional regulator [Mobilicoccus pelagius NBRC 104925]
MKTTRRLAFDPIRRAAVLWERTWGTASAPQSMATATSVMRVQQLLLAEFDALLAEFDLTFPRFETLVLLTFSREGRLPMSIVGERLMVHPTSATSLVRRLEAQGYVERVPNPDDGRGTLAVITPPGREAAERGMRRLVDAGFGLSGLTGPERVELFRLLEKVRIGHGDVRPAEAQD